MISHTSFNMYVATKTCVTYCLSNCIDMCIIPILILLQMSNRLFDKNRLDSFSKVQKSLRPVSQDLDELRPSEFEQINDNEIKNIYLIYKIVKSVSITELTIGK